MTISMEIPITEVPVDPWPTDVERKGLVFRREKVAVWNGVRDGKPVCVTEIEDRCVVHAPIVGTLADSPGLGWKLARKLDLFTKLSRMVIDLHGSTGGHGALSPYSVALDEAMDPVLGSWSDGGLHYLAPELLLGAPATASSDVYSLGRILAFLLIGSDPPLEASAVPKLDFLKSAPAGLGRIIRKATLGNPQLRYPDIETMLADVARYGEFDKVGVALPEAIELNKTGMSNPPPIMKKTIEIVRPRPQVHRQPAPPSRAAKAFVPLVVVFVGLVAVTFGDPIVHAFSRWHAHRTVEHDGASLGRLAGLGERDFSNAKLAHADLSRAPLSGTTFTGADLAGAKLDGADLGASMLDGADFTGASAFGTNLSGADVKDARGLETVVCDADTLPPTGWTCAAGTLSPKK